MNYDWKGFQSVFYPAKKAHLPVGVAAQDIHAPVYFVVEEGIIVAGFSGTDDFRDWIGAKVEEAIAHFRTREVVQFERKEIDRWVSDSMTQPHFHSQVQNMRSHAIPQLGSAKPRIQSGNNAKKSMNIARAMHREWLETLVRRNFLLENIRGWWLKFLPGTYGIFIRLQGGVAQDFLMIIRNGEVDVFHEPELASMGPDRVQRETDVVRYLSEKYMMPIQGIVVNREEWERWCQSPNPWFEVTRAIKANRLKLAPFRLSVISLVYSKAWIGI